MQQSRRSGFIRRLMAVGVLVVAVDITDSAQAASSNGPYYAPPSWDQKFTRFDQVCRLD